jgi:methyltransferase-like protein/2-polyprenyl-3-methyl-5-hydroxy-6-metoxy-1,4-benzoquinol methylase
MSDDMFASLPTVPDVAPNQGTSYDEVPYDSHPFAQTHPSRLFTIGTLFGMRPAPVQRCRVLELACAGGGNLIPMADYLPDSEFVGIDLSAKQIDEGKRTIDELGLKNLTLRKADILEVDAAFGTFDYIIAHGVYSWVPGPVRQKVLDLISKQLNPNGIAYVSYNTYPGWHMRGMIRDMMRYHSGRFNQAPERVRQARALLDFLAQSVKQDGPYSQLLKTELETIRHQADHYLYHEHLEEVNEPLYFHQFADLAKAKGLKYLGEARVGTMVTGNFGPDIEKTLRLLASDQIQAEQYMDFLRNRMFRETLLCKEGVQPNWTVQPEAMRVLHVAAPAQPVLPDGQNEINIKDESPVAYRSPSGMSMTTNRPLLKCVMTILQEVFPGTIPFDSLRRQARERLGGGDPNNAKLANEDTQLVAVGLLNCFMSSDLVELHGMPITFARTPSERPVALHHARILAANSGVASNRRHEVVRLNELDKQLIPLLDGTNDRASLITKLTEIARTGAMNVRREELTLSEPAEIRAALESIIDQALNNVAKLAVLVG